MESVDIELRVKEAKSEVKSIKMALGNYLKKIEIEKENNYNFFGVGEENSHLLTELKANMRFWFRAFNPIDISTLWEIEGILFGNSEKNKSPFSIKLREIANEKSESIKLKLILFSYIEKKYSSLMGEKNTEVIENVVNRLVEEEKISNNIEKEYIIKALNIVLDAKQGIIWYKKLLELSIILGGVGEKIRSNHGILLLDTSENENDLEQKIKSLIENITLINNDSFMGIDGVKELNKTCKCEIAFDENIIDDRPLEKVISAYNKDEIEYHMFDKEKYKKLDKKMKNIKVFNDYNDFLKT